MTNHSRPFFFFSVEKLSTFISAFVVVVVVVLTFDDKLRIEAAASN